MLVSKNYVQPQSAYRLQKEMVAISISVDDVHGVGGNLEPGDYVNLLSTFTPVMDNPATQVDETKEQFTVALYQKVKILYIGNTPAPQPGDVPSTANGAAAAPAAAQNTGVITVEVPPEAASRIISAVNSNGGGGITLELVNPDYTPVAVPVILNIQDYTGRNIQGTYTPALGNTPYPNDQVPE
jgi:Flp pilus assembly protein CpaB